MAELRLLTARQLRQAQCCLRRRVQTADMGDHHRRVQKSPGAQVQGLHQVVGVAAGGAHDVGGIIVDIVEVHPGAEGGVHWPGKKVQTPVPAQNGAGELHHG